VVKLKALKLVRLKIVQRTLSGWRLFLAPQNRSALGAFYRRLRSRLGAPKAITATAHKIARMFYQMWTTAGQYTDPGMDYYEQQYHDRIVKNLQKKADALGLELVPKSQDPQNTPSSLTLAT